MGCFPWGRKNPDNMESDEKNETNQPGSAKNSSRNDDKNVINTSSTRNGAGDNSAGNQNQFDNNIYHSNGIQDKPSYLSYNTPSPITITSAYLIQEIKSNPFDHYDKIRWIGSGASSQVYKVKEIETNIVRALKIMQWSESNESSPGCSLDVFLKEITILKIIDHPNIMKVYNYYHLEKKSFSILTESIAEGELFTKLQTKKKFPEKICAKIMCQIFSALKYWHNNYIVHRDIKPENIWVEDETTFQVKIADFGTAEILRKNEKLNKKIGTPAYMAPEVCMDKPIYDFKCDIWSSGVVMYYLLSGNKPFSGATDNEVFHSVIHRDINFDRPEWKDISEEAKQLLKMLLNRDQIKRISAKDAWTNEWITKNNAVPFWELDGNVIYDIISNNVLEFIPKNKLQLTVTYYLVHNKIDYSGDQDIKDIISIFNFFDADKDGWLSFNEIVSGLSKYISDDKVDCEARRIIQIFNDDFNSNSNTNDYFLKYEEFIIMAYDKKKLLNAKNIQAAFKFLDRELKGKITPEGLKIIFDQDKIYGNETWGVIYNEIWGFDKGYNGERSLNYVQFSKMMKELALSDEY